jgi:Leucine-rich repeat (LRR) protein
MKTFLRFSFLCCVLTVSFFSTSVLQAQTRYWVGGASPDWTNVLNWATTSGGAPPAAVPAGAGWTAVFDNLSGGTPTFTVNIPNGVTIQCQGANGVNLNQAGIFANVTMFNGGNINFLAATTVPVFTVNGGSIANIGNAAVGTVNFPTGPGALTWSGNVTAMNITGGATVRHFSGNIGTLNVSNGVFEVPAGHTVSLTDPGSSISAPGVMQIFGTLQVNNGASLANTSTISVGAPPSGGQFILRPTSTFSGSGTIFFAGNSPGINLIIDGNPTWTHPAPSYQFFGSYNSLLYIGTTARTVAANQEFPGGGAQNINVSIANTSGITLPGGNDKTINGTLTLTNNGYLRIGDNTGTTNFFCAASSLGGGTSVLELAGNGFWTGVAANYTGPCTLVYSGTVLRTVGNELPSPMPQNVRFEQNTTININRNQTYDGSVQFGNGLGGTVINLSSLGTSYTSTFNGPLTFNFTGTGGFTAAAQNNRFIVQGTGTITNTTGFRVQGAEPLEYLEMNRMGQTMNIATNLTLNANPALALNNGFIETNAEIFVSNTAGGAITGGSSMSFVRTTPTGGLIRSVVSADAFFPVGNPAGQYMPFWLRNPTLTGISPQSTLVRAVNGPIPIPGAADNTTLLGPLAPEYWYVDTFGGGTDNITTQIELGSPSVTNSPLSDVGVTTPFAAVNSPYGGAGGLNLPVFTAGTPNRVRSSNAASVVITGNHSPRYFSVGRSAAPTTYYYHAPLGFPPTNPNGWTSMVGGGGIPAAGFNSGFTFIIPDGQTASYTSNFTIPTGVIFQVDNAGAGGTLEINGEFNITNNGTLTYLGANATLRYTGGIANHTTGGEFPAAMPGTVIVNRAAGFQLNLLGNKTISGACQVQSGIFRPASWQHTINNLNISGMNAVLETGGASGDQLTLTGTAEVSAGGVLQILGNVNPDHVIINGGTTLNISNSGTLRLTQNLGNSRQISATSLGNISYAANPNGGTLEFTGGWTSAGGVNINTLPTPMNGNILVNGGSPASTLPRIINGNITVNTGSFSVASASNLTLAGTGTVTTMGLNRMQVLVGSRLIYQRTGNFDGNWFNGNAVSNLSIDNMAGVTLTNPLTVNQNLNLTNGVFTTSTTPTLTVVGTITGGATTRYINGPVSVSFPASSTTTKDVPVGRGTSYLPVRLQMIQTNGGPNAVFDVEAYNYHCNGTAIARPLGNEHWRIQTANAGSVMAGGQLILGTTSPIAADARIGYAGAPGFRNGGYTLISPTTVAFGSPNTAQIALPGAPQNFLAIAGAEVTTFYYQSGVAENPANWNSNINGGGSQPTNFITAGNVFIVPNGRNAAFTMPTTFAPGTRLQIESGGAVTVPNGITLTQSALWVNGSGRLTLQGSGAIAGQPVSYLAPTAVLEYNAPVNRLTSTTELPNTMLGQIEIHSGSVRLDTDKHLQSTLLVNNSTVNFHLANRLRLSNAMTFLGANTSFQTDNSDTLIIDSIGTIAGNLFVPELARLTMNRAGGRAFNIAGTVRVAEQLRLLNGNIRLNTNEALILQNGADTALVGGGASSYVVGAMVRRLRPNLNAMTPSAFPFPIGTATRFLGTVLQNSTTGSMGADVGIEPFATGAGGSVAPGVNGAVSQTEHWRVVPIGGEFLGGSLSLFRAVPPLAPSLVVGTSTQRSGTYFPVGGTLVGTPFGQALQSSSVQHGTTPFAALGQERFYAMLGTLPNAPRITGFAPSSGGIGTMITVTGANFTGVNAVSIGGVPVASFRILTDSLFTASIGNGVSGAVQISGITGGASSDSLFRFIPPPSIGVITPNPAGFGLPITITGANLGGTVFISIGGIPIPISPAIFLPDGNIRVVVPTNVTNANIIITTPGGSLESTSALVLVPRPTISMISPQIASTGEVITITGQNFQNTRSVRFGGGTSRVVSVGAGFTVNSPNRLSVVVPPRVLRPLATTQTLALVQESAKEGASLHNADLVPITVETAGGIATTGTAQSSQFFYRTTPIGTAGSGGGGIGATPFVSIDAVLDRIAALGSRVRITGANLDIVADIRLATTLGSTQASWFNASPSSLSIAVPLTGLLQSTSQSASMSSSMIPVTIELFGAYNSTIATNAFTLAALPSVLSIQPTNAEVGETITITGTNLDVVTQATIGGVPVPFVRDNSGQIRITVPIAPSTNGSMNPPAGQVQLSGVGGSVVSPQTLINPAYLTGLPIITNFSPRSGEGGTVIVVTGANLSAILDVIVGGVSVQSFVVNNPNRVTIVLSTETAARSAGNISLVTANGVVESRQTFTFTQSLENDLVQLANALGISLDAVRGRIRTEQNRIISLDASNLRFANNTIPEQIRRLRNLRVLNLSNSGLTGSIPMWLSEFRDLEELDISRNNLTGDLQGETVCIFPNLRLLNVSSNQLSGTIPLCIATREKIQILRLEKNRFTGAIPPELGTMPNLRILTLNDNNLTGSLPASFGAFTLQGTKSTSRTQNAQTLELLDMSNNQLSGSVPREWGNMAVLTTLNLSNNRLSGVLPQELGNMSSLERLNLSRNQFSGSIPTTFSQFTKLRELRINANQFSNLPELRTRLMDTLEVQQNRLDFGALESFMDLRNVATVRFVYAPQDSIGEASSRNLRVSESFTLTLLTSSTGNRYEWFKNGEVLSGVQGNTVTPILRFSAITLANAGVYTCRITNSRVPDLVLYSRPQTIVVTNAGLTLLAPELRFPTHRSENIGVQTRLAWTRIAGADGYEVQWANNADLRNNVERRFIAQSYSETSATVETRIAGLGRGEQIFWRVRAISGARISAAESASSQWSEVFAFTVVPLGVDLAVGTLNAGKVSIGEQRFAESVAANVGNDVIFVENISVDAADAARFELLTTIQQGSPVMLASGAELPVRVAFTPRETGSTTGTLRLRYRDGQGIVRNVSFQAAARGVGSALGVQDVNFETMRIGRRTLRSAQLVNRSSEAVRLIRTSIRAERGQVASDVVFTAQDNIGLGDNILIAAGDTLPVVIAARPRSIGEQRNTLEILIASTFGTLSVNTQGALTMQGGWIDTVLVPVRGFARLPDSADASLRLGIRATPDSVAPGGTTTIQVYIVEDNKQAVLGAATPVLQGTVRFSKQVLNLSRTGTNGARILRERTQTNDLQRITIPPTNWDGRNDVVFSFAANAVAGKIDVTKLEIENIAWGSRDAQTQRQPWESQVFIEDPKDSNFTAMACRAGGKRLVTSAQATSLAVIRPNPVKDVAEVQMTLREDGSITLELVNMSGQVVKILREGEHRAGLHEMMLDCSHIPSGAYMLRLRTNERVVSERIQIVR